MIVIDMNMPTDCVDCWINCQTDTCPIKCDIEDIKAEIEQMETLVTKFEILRIIEKRIGAEMESEERGE